MVNSHRAINPVRHVRKSFSAALPKATTSSCAFAILIRLEGTRRQRSTTFFHFLPTCGKRLLAVHFSSPVSLEFEHFRDGPAGLEELVLRYLPVAVEVALTEATLHLAIDLIIVQRLALQEGLALCDTENGMGS